jgi:BON domain
LRSHPDVHPRSSRGARRRALVRDKFVRAARQTRDAAGATKRDIGNRLTGAAARARSLMADEAVDDRIVCERVRAELGRFAPHPRAIHVSSNGGVVTLSGDALADDVPMIVSRVSRVLGVQNVRNEIASHATAERVPALQGRAVRPGWRSTWIRESWSPAAAVAAAIAATTLAIAIARR